MRFFRRLWDQLSGRRVFEAINEQTRLIDSWAMNTEVLNGILSDLVEDQRHA